MPKRLHNALTIAKIQAAQTGAHSDGNGLTLVVDNEGNRRWVQRLRIRGDRRNVGLGGYPTVGLREARAKARENLKAIRQGRDIAIAPRKARQTRRARQTVKAGPTVPTFQQAAAEVIELRRPTWSNERHAKQWAESLRLHAYPVIGRKRVDNITPADVLALLLPIWTAKPETGGRVRQRLETIFDYCQVMGWRTDNPAASVAAALPRRTRTVRHHRALPVNQIPDAVRAIRQSPARPSTRLALEFVILTAARAGEVRGMTWDEIDIEARQWTIPARRMKSRRQHRSPLSTQAVDVLLRAADVARRKRDRLIFQSNGGRELSNMAFTAMLNRLKINATTHGFRSSFRDWCIETDAPWTVAETALAHRLGNSLESAYARTDLFDKRRTLMQQWADFATGRC